MSRCDSDETITFMVGLSLMLRTMLKIVGLAAIATNCIMITFLILMLCIFGHVTLVEGSRVIVYIELAFSITAIYGLVDVWRKK